jgi:hypothetical protein
VNFVEISSATGPLLLNLDHVTSVQVGAATGAPQSLIIGLRGVTEPSVVPCPDAEQVYAFLREQLRPTSFVLKKPTKVGFAAQI